MFSLGRLSAWLAAFPLVARAMAWMLLAVGLFSLTMVLVRLAAGVLHPFQIAFLRAFFGFLILLPWLSRTGISGLRTTKLSLHLIRAGVGTVSVLLWFSALALLPLAQAVALSFTAPLFATVFAATFLREGSGPRRLTAAGIGFLGTLIILRPGVLVISPAAVLALASACAFAINIILTKIILRTDSPDATVTTMTLFLIPLSLPAAIWVWQWPDGPTLALMAALGAVATSGHLCFARAMKLADASAILPLDFVRLPLTALIAYLAFGEHVDLWTWTGAVIIAVSATYIARREVTAAQQVATKQ